MCNFKSASGAQSAAIEWHASCCFADRLHALQEFVGLLAAFSRNATREDKLKAIFAVYDIDGDGIVTADDLGLMLRHLAGSSLGCANHPLPLTPDSPPKFLFKNMCRVLAILLHECRQAWGGQ